MKQKVTSARKANTRCSAPYWRFQYNASVRERRQAHCYGADHIEFSQKHGILGAV